MGKGMTLDQAREMAHLFETGPRNFAVEIEQVGRGFQGPDAPWTVILNYRNSRTGVVCITIVRDFEPEAAGTIARKAMAAAKKRDREALERRSRWAQCYAS